MQIIHVCIQVSDEPQRATAAQVAHVENEIEVRAANIVRHTILPTIYVLAMDIHGIFKMCPPGACS